MRKIFFFVFFVWYIVFEPLSFGSSVNVAVIAPFKSRLSVFANDFFNGISLAVPSYVNLVKVDSDSDFVKSIKIIKPIVVVGPFSKTKVRELLNYYCNSHFLVILPFAKVKDNCTNVISYGYYPEDASKQLAEYVCNLNHSGSIGVLYSYDRVDVTDKNSFVNALNVCGKNPEVVEGVPVIYNVMDDFVRKLFGVVKLKNIEGLTTGKVFGHYFNIGTLVVFAPENIFLHLVSLMDYYSIYPQRILSVNLVVNSKLLSLSMRMRKIIKFITPYFMCQRSSFAQKFLSSYRNSFYKDPAFVSALGYDIGNILNDYLEGRNILNETDRDFLIGHLLFFDVSGRAELNYRMIGYKEFKECRGQILNR